MTWAVSNRRSVRRARHTEGAVASTVSWPRGLAIAGIATMLVSAWGALVPFLGPAIGYHANGSPSWNWSSEHAWLYVLPGVVGFVISLGVIGRSRSGRTLTRVSLAFMGLVLTACGAWFVLGPAAWAVVSTGGAFSTSQSALDHFTALVGYNLGVGLVVAIGGGIVISASLGERQVLVMPKDPVVQEPRPYPAQPVEQAAYSDPTPAYPAQTEPTATQGLPHYSPADREA